MYNARSRVISLLHSLLSKMHLIQLLINKPILDHLNKEGCLISLLLASVCLLRMSKQTLIETL